MGSPRLARFLIVACAAAPLHAACSPACEAGHYCAGATCAPVPQECAALVHAAGDEAQCVDASAQQLTPTHPCVPYFCAEPTLVAAGLAAGAPPCAQSPKASLKTCDAALSIRTPCKDGFCAAGLTCAPLRVAMTFPVEHERYCVEADAGAYSCKFSWTPWSMSKRMWCCANKNAGCMTRRWLGWVSGKKACLEAPETSDALQCCNRYGVLCGAGRHCHAKNARTTLKWRAREACCASEDVLCAVDCQKPGLNLLQKGYCCRAKGLFCEDIATWKAEEAKVWKQWLGRWRGVATGEYRLRVREDGSLDDAAENPKRLVKRVRLALVLASRRLRGDPARLRVARIGALAANGSVEWSVHAALQWQGSETLREEQDAVAAAGSLDDAGTGTGTGSRRASVLSETCLFVDYDIMDTDADIAKVQVAISERITREGVLSTGGHLQEVVPVGLPSVVSLSPASNEPNKEHLHQPEHQGGVGATLVAGCIAAVVFAAACVVCIVKRRAQQSADDSILIGGQVYRIEDHYDHNCNQSYSYREMSENGSTPAGCVIEAGTL